MLTPLKLSAVFALASFLAVLLCTWDAVLSLRISLAPAALVLTVCAMGEWNVHWAEVEGRRERAKYRPLVTHRIIDHVMSVAPVLDAVFPAVPSLNTATTQRSIVLNANGESHTLALTPEPSSDALRVRAMLDVALALPTRDPSRFPSVRAMERAGCAYKDYDYALSLIETRILRSQSGIRVVSGTVRELRDSV